MNDGIIVGAGDENRLLKSINNDVTDSIDRICDEAKAHGMTFVDYVKAQWSTWSSDYDARALFGKWVEFLNCVDKELEKIPPGEGKWDVTDTFDDYLRLSVVDAQSRLDELNERKKAGARSFIEDETILSNMSNVQPGVGEHIRPEFYEFLEEIIRRSLEIMRKCVGNEELTNRLLERGKELDDLDREMEKREDMVKNEAEKALREVGQMSS